MFPFRRKFALLVVAASAGFPLRAQVTETPQTIEPGKFLVRMDAISLRFDRADAAPNTYTALGVASTILSTGLTQDVDMQIGVDLFLRQTVRYRGSSSTHSGLGDVSLRTKWTFWRDAANGAAAAVIPYIKVPTHRGGVSDDHVEGGVIVPWSMALGTGTSAGAMAQWDVLRNDANDGYDSRWYASGFINQELTKAVGIYGEATFGISSASSSSFAGTIGGGATLNLSRNFQWDFGLSRGLGGRATDWTSVLRFRWSF